MITYGVTQYQQTQVMTASSVQLIVLLYESAMRSLELAREGILRNNHMDKGRFLGRAIAIVSELSNTLDMERGGEIAVSLRRLYDYMLGEFTWANLRHDPKPLEGPLRCLSTLCEAWQTVAREGTSPRAVGS
ncbi:MAG: flagellar export chaperone FliS [Nitrospirota bacterium]